MRHPPFSKWLKIMWASQLPRRVPKQWIRFMIHCLKHHRDPRVRHRIACHAVASADAGGKPLSALIRMASDPKEHPVLRGQALETLAWPARCATGRAARRARKTVLKCLRDPDGNVRFWACFAVSQMRIWEAIPILKGMLCDEAVSIMNWTVGYEAGEAIKELQGELAWEDTPESRPHDYLHLWDGDAPSI